jgi:hypothetical protein
VILNVDEQTYYNFKEVVNDFNTLICVLLYVCRRSPLFLILPRISDVIHNHVSVSCLILCYVVRFEKYTSISDIT